MKIVLEVTLADDVNPERVAEDLFDWLCTGGEDDMPDGVETFDWWDVTYAEGERPSV